MSNLAEIQAEVAALPQQDQWSLLHWLHDRLKTPDGTDVPTTHDDRRQWLTELSRLREFHSTGVKGEPLQPS